MSENTVKLIQRSDIEEQYKWKTEDIYPSLEAWEKDFKKVRELSQQFDKFVGHLGDSADTMLKCFQLREEITTIAGRLMHYATRKKDEDTRIAENQSLFNRSLSLMNDARSAMSFVVPEILSISDEKLNSFLETNYELALYRHHIEDITRVRSHILSAELEKVVAMAEEMSSGPGQIFEMIDDADIKYPVIKDEEGNDVELTKGRYFRFMQGKDRRVREDAFKAFYKPYEGLKNTIATTLAYNIKGEMFNAKVRNYNTTREAALDPDNIPVSVYDNLIKAVSDNLDPMYKYVKLRKKLLGIDELHMYDIYVSIIKEAEWEIPYEEAKETIITAMAPLGKDYQALLRRGLESRWVDVYENEGKASGAYSSGLFGVHPFVLMNYNNTLDSMFTLAHEMGHALHSYLSNEYQPYIYHRYKIFLAEVASTLNEALLMDYLLKHTEDKARKLVVLNHFLEQYRGTVYRQTMFAEFEKLIHEKAENGEVLTHENLCGTYYELNKKYYGPDMVLDPQIAMEWARIPHFYMNFYVYKYATGFSAATSLAQQILKEGQPAVDRYLGFLKAGDHDYPINILKKAGVDMTTPEPVVQALNQFRDLVDEMERLTNE